MGEVIILADGEEIEAGLEKIEAYFPDIRADYARLRDNWGNPTAGWMLAPEKYPAQQDKRYRDLPSGRGPNAKNAAVLVYTCVIDEDRDYLITPMFVCLGSEWRMYERYAKKLLGLG
jgi:hypothetical protein